MRAAAQSESDPGTESETIRLAQQGDPEACERLYRLHSRRVFALCLRMAGNLSEAEDLTQDSFLQVFRRIQSFRGESAFSTWLHRVTVNTVLMRFRKKKLTEISLDEASNPEEESLKSPLQLGERDLGLSGVIDRVTLQHAIDQLPPGYKDMFILHDVEGYRHDEIAEILGCSIGNSKSQLHKARMRMRELLRNDAREARENRDEPALGARPLQERPDSDKPLATGGYRLAFERS